MFRFFLPWLKMRRAFLLYVAAVFGFFFWVYALHGYEWGVAGYAALLGLTTGAVLAAWDFSRLLYRHRALEQLKGRFPVEKPFEPSTLLERDYGEIIAALEAERARLENEREQVRRDEEEYYMLWAHQIKTPIAALQLLLQSRAGGISEEARHALEQELFRIGQYVGMVLQYQRLFSIGSDLVLEAFSLPTLVKRAARGCAVLFIHKGLSLETEDVGAIAVVTDEKWFCFVLEQLFTNAVKYTAAGTIRVYTRDGNLPLAAAPGDSNHSAASLSDTSSRSSASTEQPEAAPPPETAASVTLVIEDSGIGIPAEDLPRVFERGFTGAAGRTERSSTGIGLYLCRRILARLGFGITLESEVGKGTRVLLQLSQRKLELD